MSGEKHAVRGWSRLIRLPHLFSVPGDVAMGFLLVLGVTNGPVPYGTILFLASAAPFCCLAGGIVNDLADLKIDCMERPNRPLPAQEVPVRAALIAAIASVILALCFSALTPNTFLLCAALLVCVLRYDFSHNGAGQHKIVYFALCRFLGFAIGAAGAAELLYERGGMPLIRSGWPAFAAAGVFGIGIFSYWLGVAKAMRDRSRIMAKRPGFRLFLTGAVIAYAVLFWIVVRKPTSDWHLLTCGIVSALTSAVFAVITYWCFRLFHYPIPPHQTRRTLDLFPFAWCFLQSAAAAAQNELSMALILSVLAVLCKITSKKLEGDIRT